MLEELKSPSDTAWIAAATNIASVPVPSSGAWNLIAPMTSLAAISVSPVCSVSTIGLSSAVAVCFNFNPTSASWVKVISWSLPNWIVPASARNKSENSAEADPKVAPSALEGIIEVVICGLVNVLFVNVAVEAVETRSTLPPVLGSVKVFEALSECGAACSVCAWAFELSQ